METYDTLDDFTIHFDEGLPALSDIHEELPKPKLDKPDKVNKWDPRLILDLAIGVDGLQEILSRYALSEEAFNNLSRTKSFRQELALTIREVRENGVSFAQKARVQAESYLEVLNDMVVDTSVAANTKLEVIRSLVKWGRLEPEKETKDDALNATQINVNISF